MGILRVTSRSEHLDLGELGEALTFLAVFYFFYPPQILEGFRFRQYGARHNQPEAEPIQLTLIQKCSEM